ncbi:MAG: exosome complex RNA-binding protein Rrp4 [Thermoproteota archaeon]
MAKILVENRAIVTPGEPIAELDDSDIEYNPAHIIRVGNKLFPTVVGLAQIEEEGEDEKKYRVSIVPLEGVYLPKPGDVVIGLVKDIGVTHWEVDINSPYTAILTVQEVLNRPFNPAADNLRKYFDVGDYVIAKVLAFDRSRDPLLTVKGEGLGRITEGVIIEVKPSRVPRVIGKKRSMLNMLTSETGCQINVGANGRIHAICDNKAMEDLLVLAIKKIEAEAHTTGLTERIRELIRSEKERLGVG